MPKLPRATAFPPRVAPALLCAILSSGNSFAGSQAPTLGQLENLTYQGVYEQPVPLVDGVYEGQPFVPGGAARPRVELVKDPILRTDMDGDGAQDAVVLLTESSAGSGSNTYLAVVLQQASGPSNVATRLIGDRIKIRSLTPGDGTAAAVLEFVTAGPQEAACCPTSKRRDTYRLDGEALVATSSQELGALTLTDLAGAWRLTHLAWQEPLPEGAEITAVFHAGQVSGAAGCNRYSGQVRAGHPYALSIGPLATTRMACPGELQEIEDRYLRALEASSAFNFLFGNLALTYRSSDTAGVLLFARVP